MKLWAISDLHVGYAANRQVIDEMAPRPGDWLILAGDLGESIDHMRYVFSTLMLRFGRLIWVPGNHELWTTPREESLRGQSKYERLVELCREYGVLTPEDPYAVFQSGEKRYLIAPMFLLYDYSFAPDGISADAARAWAREAGLECADEHLLHPEPYSSLPAWCAARCAYTEARLTQALRTHAGPTVLINHFPLRIEHAELPLIPRFCIWCGTRRTHDWHQRFRAEVVVYGHLHIRRQRSLDGVRFEEVSLGYPRQWTRRGEVATQLVQILPQQR